MVLAGQDELVDAVQRLSAARSLEEIKTVVRCAARRLTGADGATLVIRDGDECFYAEEDAIRPLWKGQRFPIRACISGWAMLNRQRVVIEDVYRDDRIVQDVYRRTFVKSLAMLPIRRLDPIGAIGTYWASRHRATASELGVLQVLADSIGAAMENVRVVRQLGNARLETLQRLALAAEYRDDGTHEHTERVAWISRALASQLGLEADEVSLIYQGAPVHDVGKLAVPEAILLKPGSLTPSEFEEVKRHTTIGGAILSGSESEALQTAAEIALTHHEWWDGSGYPAGLVGDEIPVSGRVVGLADVFDAVTHARPYKDAWPVQQAVRQICCLNGRQFDPQVVDAFLELEPNELVDPPDGSGTSADPEQSADRSRRRPDRPAINGSSVGSRSCEPATFNPNRTQRSQKM